MDHEEIDDDFLRRNGFEWKQALYADRYEWQWGSYTNDTDYGHRSYMPIVTYGKMKFAGDEMMARMFNGVSKHITKKQSMREFTEFASFLLSGQT